MEDEEMKVDSSDEEGQEEPQSPPVDMAQRLSKFVLKLSMNKKMDMISESNQQKPLYHFKSIPEIPCAFSGPLKSTKSTRQDFLKNQS